MLLAKGACRRVPRRCSVSLNATRVQPAEAPPTTARASTEGKGTCPHGDSMKKALILVALAVVALVGWWNWYFRDIMWPNV